MKRLVLSGLLAAAVATPFAAPLIAGPGGPGGHACHRGGPEHPPPALNLTDEQREALRSQRDGQRERARGLHDALREARSTGDAAAAGAAQAELNTLHTAGHGHGARGPHAGHGPPLEHRLEGLGLTDDQWAAVRAERDARSARAQELRDAAADAQRALRALHEELLEATAAHLTDEQKAALAQPPRRDRGPGQRVRPMMGFPGHP